MTDGPFRNSALSSRWKQYGGDLISDATSPEERTAQACYSMLGDVDVNAISSLLKELKTSARCTQMELDPVVPVDAIFGSYSPSPLADTIQKHLAAKLRDQIPPEVALDQALTSSITEWIGTTKNRMDDECISAHARGDMSREDYRKGLERNRKTFAAISPGVLCVPLASGNKRAFKRAIQKKDGVDEGPDE
jgi:hypothetical protein